MLIFLNGESRDHVFKEGEKIETIRFGGTEKATAVYPANQPKFGLLNWLLQKPVLGERSRRFLFVREPPPRWHLLPPPLAPSLDLALYLRYSFRP